ncbi:MAG: alkylmercury lyase family protein [candidate division WOR-3 bacterium]|nr:MAG: alkylmercury lyase family protein [candidate division WOR-3 bacterium]
MRENKSTKAERGRCELNSSEKEVMKQIFTEIMSFGKPPTIAELQATLKKSSGDIIKVINTLEEKDILLRSKETKEVVSIYPISLRPTEHLVVMSDGTNFFAMCAMDALGIPNMFNQSATINSQCEWCKQKITIEIDDAEIKSQSHSDIHIWSPQERKIPAAETCCPLVNFFCSHSHLEEWKIKNPDLAEKGHSSLLEQAYPCIKECWTRYGEMIGLR